MTHKQRSYDQVASLLEDLGVHSSPGWALVVQQQWERVGLSKLTGEQMMAVAGLITAVAGAVAGADSAASMQSISGKVRKAISRVRKEQAS